MELRRSATLRSGSGFNPFGCRKKTLPATSFFARVQPELADPASQFDVPEVLQNVVLIFAAVLAIGSTVLSPALRRRNS